MKTINFEDIRGYTGLGSSARTVLGNFIERGATVKLISYNKITSARYFIVELDGMQIPIRSEKLNFYCVLNSLLAQTVTTNKLVTDHFLETYDIPKPDMISFQDFEQSQNFLTKNKQIVVKPFDGSHGEGITVGVTSDSQLRIAIDHAEKYSKTVLLQEHIDGADFRLLFLDCKFVAAVKRIPAYVVGDGVLQVSELLNKVNDERRTFRNNRKNGTCEEGDLLGSISETPLAEVVAAKGNEILSMIPAYGQRMQVLDKANVSLGGQTVAVDVDADSSFIKKLENFFRQIDLRICGVDVISKSENGSFDPDNCSVIEMNAAPGFRLHEFPFEGKAVSVSTIVSDMLESKHKKL